MPDLQYRAEITSRDGSLIASNTNSTFILPASEKYILLPRFKSDINPSQINFSLLNSRYVVKPNLPDIRLDIQRSQVVVVENETITTGVIKNNSPFTVTQVNLVAVYNERSQLVALNYTNINDLVTGELRKLV